MLCYLAVTIAFAILTSCGVQADGEQNKINVDVYYESLCPYSVLFITKQLVPAYEPLKDFIKVNFVPYGKASYVLGDPTKFTCQHGPDECHGNRAQACALYEIQLHVQLEKQQQKAVDVVGCVMGNSRPSYAVPQCIKQSNLSKESIVRVKNCIRSSALSDSLLISYGDKTKAFESPLQGVPSVAINGVKNKDAVSDFIGEICKLIPSNEQPRVCTQSE